MKNNERSCDSISFFEDKNKCISCEKIETCLDEMYSLMKCISRIGLEFWGILLTVLFGLIAIVPQNMFTFIILILILFFICVCFLHYFSVKKKNKMKAIILDCIDENKKLNNIERCQNDNCLFRKRAEYLTNTLEFPEMDDNTKRVYNDFKACLTHTQNVTIYKSRNEYLEAASLSRRTANESHHVMYLTESSITIYQNEGEKWLENDSQAINKNKNQRIVIIDKNDFDKSSNFKNIILRTIVNLQETSTIKCTFSNRIEDWNVDLLKDFGIFLMQGMRYHGFFIKPNFRKYCELKYLFSMSTGDFYKIEGNGDTYIIKKYEDLFNNAWTTGNIRWVSLDLLERLCKNKIYD